MGRGQVVRQRVLVPSFVGSNPAAPASPSLPQRLIEVQTGVSSHICQRCGAGRRPGQAHEVGASQGACTRCAAGPCCCTCSLPPGPWQPSVRSWCSATATSRCVPLPAAGLRGRSAGAATGHRPRRAGRCRPDLPGHMLVLPGDTPLVTGEALLALVRDHTLRQRPPPCSPWNWKIPPATAASCAMPTARCCASSSIATRPRRSSPSTRSTVACTCCRPVQTLDILRDVGTDNDQQEIYLTDVIAGLRARAEGGGLEGGRPRAGAGRQLPDELAEAERLMSRSRRAVDGPAERPPTVIPYDWMTSRQGGARAWQSGNRGGARG